MENQRYVSWYSTPEDHQAWLVISLKNIDHHDHFMQMFMQFLLFGSLLALLVIVGLGWWMIQHGLKPLKHFGQLASKVSGENLSHRLVTETLPSELKPLAHTFNAMLDRLEDAFLRLNQFSADLAHEFRTPINNLMMQSQVALSQPRDNSDYQDILASNIEEFERLARMVSDMLLLAKTEQQQPIEKQLVELRPLCQQLMEYFELLAAERDIVFELQGEAQLQANAELLRRALANILANAVRHADSQSTIQITLSQTAKQIEIHICNQGETIAPEQLGQLFERFYRAESARTNRGGSGLGLAITRAIIQAHQGKIHATSQANQTCFVINLNLGL
jgi:two-component system heavy metal sensor histidine kinase CusS